MKTFASGLKLFVRPKVLVRTSLEVDLQLTSVDYGVVQFCLGSLGVGGVREGYEGESFGHSGLVVSSDGHVGD